MKKLSIQRIILALIAALFIGVSGYLIINREKVTTPTVSYAPEKTVPTISRSKKAVYPDEVPGKIVTLKKLTLKDTFDYYTMFSPMVRKAMEFPEKITFGYIEYYVRLELEKMEKGDLIVYCIWDNKTNKMTGAINIRYKSDEDPGQLGMWLNEAFWGGGRIQEALLLISKAYFDANPKEVEYNAYVRPWNNRSAASLMKFGFKKISDQGVWQNAPADIFELRKETLKDKSL
jgi:RimJ/RimL family protein N-acetyltransferase